MQQTAIARVIKNTIVRLVKNDITDTIKAMLNSHLQMPSLSFIDKISANQAKNTPIIFFPSYIYFRNRSISISQTAYLDTPC